MSMTKSNSSVQSVERALCILNLLKDHPGGMGITQIAKKLEVAKSSAHRLTTALCNFGLVTKNLENDKYLLGLKLVELGETVLETLDIRTVAQPYLQKLVNELDETVHLVILENCEIVYIDKIESPQTIRMYSRIGRRAPVHCTGVGKAIMAFFPEEEIDQIITEKGLHRFTEYTHTNRESLLANLDEIRSRGFSIDEQEHELGIRCVAAPVFNHHNKVVAGVSVAAPTYRLPTTMVEEYAAKLTACAGSISRGLGNRKQ
ncbi:IclR family transcriptional regulator [Mesobacillus foraminis]|uniref:Glycerol operon regulatory protein n=2 Tax=Mesobacillus foraminis TaxID=279826 RepID=A0A4R2BLM3_9BACI|nr:IclR family transcriptional regulator [Mesobacillus foraminis]TCN28158.1 IclR family transcriptional regulator [Mesobacillus foraminis]